MNCVDGFVLAVTTANRETHCEFAATSTAVTKEHGALSIVECWGDDVPEGKLASFSIASSLIDCWPANR